MSIQFQSQYLRETKVKEMSVAAGAGPILPALNVPAKKYKGPEMNKESALNLTTADRLVLQAKKDGYIVGDYSQAVLSAAKKVGSKFDELQPEEQRAMRDRYYDLFLQAANLKKAGVQEDAPMLAAGKADISTYTQDGFKKTEGHPKLKSIDVDDLWDTKPTAMSEELEETWYKPDYKKILQLLSKIKEKNESVYEKIKYALEMDLAPHTYSDVVDAAAKAGIQENYNRFKKETKIRPKQDQYHEAIKAVNKKLDEVNRILEFTTRMKEELSEGEETLEVKARTAKSMDKLKTKIAEAYKKLKHLN